MDIVWVKKTYAAIREKLDRSQFITPGDISQLELAPKEVKVDVSQQVDPKGGAATPAGPVEQLSYPKPLKETSNMNKASAQQLPGTDKVDAVGQITPSEPTKLTKLIFPTKPAADPKVGGPGLEKSTDAQKQITEGEHGKLLFPSSGGPKIKIDWNVGIDSSVAKQFTDGGEKGDIKKVKGPAKEPGVSQAKVPGDAAMGDFERTKPIQKQFSVNWKKYSAEERVGIADQAIDCAISDLEVAADITGVPLEQTELGTAMAALKSAKANLAKSGSVAPAAKPALPTPLKPTASVKKTVVDLDKAATETGLQIF